MARTLDAIHARLIRVPRATTGALAVVLILLVGVVDWAVGPELSTSVFYVAPISLAAWYAGTRWTAGACLLAALAWYAVERSQVTFTAEWIGVWNASMRLAFFAIVTLLIRRVALLMAAQRALAETDPRTGLANARRFVALVESEVGRTTRYGGPVTLVYIDLDGFKAVNDRWGHAAGDRVLEVVGSTLARQVRGTDVPARMGGDEFGLLLPATDGVSASRVIDKLRASLEVAMTDGGWPVGFSMGVVTSSDGSLGARELIRLADDLMYEAKHGGKGSTAFRVMEEGV